MVANLKGISVTEGTTPVTRRREAYRMPFDCGKYYAGRTHQNLEKRLQHHKDDITKALNSTNANASFDSALSSHVFENPSTKILFEGSTLFSNGVGIKQVVREAIEIRLKTNNNFFLNSDLGEYSINAL